MSRYRYRFQIFLDTILRIRIVVLLIKITDEKKNVTL